MALVPCRPWDPEWHLKTLQGWLILVCLLEQKLMLSSPLQLSQWLPVPAGCLPAETEPPDCYIFLESERTVPPHQCTQCRWGSWKSHHLSSHSPQALRRTPIKPPLAQQDSWLNCSHTAFNVCSLFKRGLGLHITQIPIVGSVIFPQLQHLSCCWQVEHSPLLFTATSDLWVGYRHLSFLSQCSVSQLYTEQPNKLYSKITARELPQVLKHLSALTACLNDPALLEDGFNWWKKYLFGRILASICGIFLRLLTFTFHACPH